MDVLPYHFRASQVGGIWYENDNFLAIKIIYKFLTFSFQILLALSQIIELVMLRNSLEEITEVLFTTLTFVCTIIKMCNFSWHQNELLNLVDDFRSPVFKPSTSKEEQILRAYSNKADKVFQYCMSVCCLTGFFFFCKPFFSIQNGDVQLPFKTYQPYNLSIESYFWTAYATQVYLIYSNIVINITLDTMVFGFIILATGQFELAHYRIMYSIKSLNKCIEHHAFVQDIVYKIQNLFMTAIAPYFFGSLITVCFSVFQLSEKNVNSLDFLCMMMYISCMLGQVFLYCWYGNELELKGGEIGTAVYSSKWLDLSNKERRTACLMMLSAKCSSKISFHGQCDLSLNTFIWIMKTSYAAFNCLKQI